MLLRFILSLSTPPQVDFIKNDAGPGAGGSIYGYDGSNYLEVAGPALTSFIGNTAAGAGGAVYLSEAFQYAQTMVVNGPLCAQDNRAGSAGGGFAYVVGSPASLAFNNPSTSNIAKNVPDDIRTDDPAPPFTATVSSSGIGPWPPGPSYTIGGPVSSATLSNGAISFAGCGAKASWNSEKCMCKVCKVSCKGHDSPDRSL